QAVLEQEVVRALDEVKASYGDDRLLEAGAGLKRAEGLLAGGGGSEELRRRVHQWRTDVDLVFRLEEIRLNLDTVKDGFFHTIGGIPLYRKAFQQYGLD